MVFVVNVDMGRYMEVVVTGLWHINGYYLGGAPACFIYKSLCG